MPPGAIRFPFGICRVCKDKATGVHYGVASCEGCKGFFKRTITRGDNYKCFFGGDCNLEPKNRNRCKSCRFRLCLETGMSVEAVRMGRIPKEEKEKALEIYQQNGSDYSKMEVLIQPSDTTHDGKGQVVNGSENTKTYLGKSSSKHIFKLKESSQLDTGNSETGAKSEKQSQSKSSNEEEKDTTKSCHQETTRNKEDLSLESLDSLVNEKIAPENPHNEAVINSSPSTDKCDTEQSVDVKPCVEALMKTQTQLPNTQKHQREYVSSSEQNNEGLSKRKSVSLDRQQHQCVSSHQPQIPVVSSNHQQHKCVSDCQQLHQHVSHKNQQVSAATHQQQQQQYVPSNHQQHQSISPHHRHHQRVPLLQQDIRSVSQHQQRCQDVYQQHGRTDHQQQFVYSNPSTYRRPHSPSHNPLSSFPMVQPQSPVHQQFNTVSYNHAKPLPPYMVPNISTLPTSQTSCNMTPYTSSIMLTAGCVQEQNVLTDSKQDISNLQLHQKQKSADGYDNTNVFYKSFDDIKGLSEDDFSSLNFNNTSAQDSVCLALPQRASIQQDYLQQERQVYTHRHGFDDGLLLDVVDGTPSKPPVCVLGSGNLPVMNRNDQCYPVPGTEYTNDVSSPDRPNSASSTGSNRSTGRISKHAGLILKVFMDHAVESGTASVLLDRLKQILMKSSQNEESIMSLINLIQDMIPQQFIPGQGSINMLQDMHQDRRSDSAESIKRLLKDVHSFSEQTSCTDGRLDHSRSSKETNELLDIIDQLNSTPDLYSIVEEGTGKKTDRDQVDSVSSLRRKHGSPERMSSSNTKYMRTDTQRFEVTSSYSVSSELEMEIKLTLENMELASNIIHRLKPEHRQKLKLFKQGQLSIPVMTDSDEDIQKVYTKIFQSIPQLNERVLGFSNNIRGFSELPKTDKEVLLKRAFYDIWMLISAEYFYDGESNILLSTGELYSTAAMRKILNDSIVERFLEFSEAFNALKLTDLEITIFCAIQLTSTDNVTLEDLSATQRLHSHLLDVFDFELKRNHSNHSNLLISIFKLLPSLTVINKLQKEIIANFSLNRFKKEGNSAEETTTTVCHSSGNRNGNQT